jgi:hypothetical protein
MLTIYALANNSNSTEDVYTSTAKKQLYIKLTHNSKTLVHKTVASLSQALSALQCYNITNVHVSYNVDCTNTIYTLANKINLHFLK